MYDYALYISALKAKVSPKRFEHCLNVAKTASKLAKIYGESQEDAEIAGILHDIAKNMDASQNLKLIKESGFPMQDFINVSPKILHGFAGSEYIKKTFGITSQNVLSAVAYHTTGKENMSMLEKIIFVSDYVSQERSWNGVEALREIAKKNINEAVIHKLTTTIIGCVSHRNAIHPYTVAAYNGIVYENHMQNEEQIKP